MKWEKDLVKDIRFFNWRDAADFPGVDAHPKGYGKGPKGFTYPPEITDCNRNALLNQFLKIKDNCKAILEIGVGRNAEDSFAYLFKDNKNKDTIYIGLDIEDRSFLNDPQNNMHTFMVDSSDYDKNLEIFKSLGVTEFDFIFIDGDHSINQFLKDWEYTNLISTNGIIGLHDTSCHFGPYNFIRNLDQEKWNVEQNLCPDDWGIGFVSMKGDQRVKPEIKKIEIKEVKKVETSKKDKTITVFYHLFIPDTNNMWIWWVDEQMGLLKSSGLSKNATINMCITIPLGLYNSKTGHSYDQMVTDYIKDRFPFVNIIDMRNVGEQPNLYEGQTLAKIYEHAQQDDGYVFYFHNKGMSSYTTHIPGAIKDWRHYMQYFNIEKWEDCIAKLDEGYDCCGVDWVERHDIKLDFVVQHYAGNFWWARNDYIRKLKHPIKIEDYMDVDAMMRELQNYRYCFELWMATGIPNQYCFHYRRHHQYDNQGLERYFIYYPREMYDESMKSDEEKIRYSKIHTLTEIGSRGNFNWRDHRLFADWIVRRKIPDIIVDLGVDYGYSTFCFALPEIGHVYGIDSFEGDEHAGVRDTFEYVLEKKKELDLDNITFIKGFFDDVIETWDKQIDILHIDGLHTYDAVKNDFQKWSKFVKDDGIILMHDTMVERFGVKDFFAEIDLPKTNFKHCNGLGVVSKDINLINEINKNFEEFIK